MPILPSSPASRINGLAAVGGRFGRVVPTKGIPFCSGELDSDWAHVPAPHDVQEGRQGPPLLAAGAQRAGGAARDPADGCAARRARRTRPRRGARACAPADRRTRAGAAVRGRQRGSDRAGASEGRPRRTPASVWRCVSGAGAVARHGPGGAVRAAAAGRQGARRLGEDGGGAGGGAVLRAVERAAHRRGLVSAHGAVRSAAARRGAGQQGSAVSQRSIICWRTRPRWKRICRSAAASCLRWRTKCCSTTSPAPTSRARRSAIRRRSAATRAITGPTASRSASRWW